MVFCALLRTFCALLYAHRHFHAISESHAPSRRVRGPNPIGTPALLTTSGMGNARVHRLLRSICDHAYARSGRRTCPAETQSRVGVVAEATDVPSPPVRPGKRVQCAPCVNTAGFFTYIPAGAILHSPSSCSIIARAAFNSDRSIWRAVRSS